MAVIVPITTYYSNVLPSDWIAPLEEALDKIGLDIEAARLTWSPDGITLRHVLHILENARMDFPIIPGSVLEFEKDDVHPGIGLEIRIKDTVTIELQDISLLLTFSPGFLRAYEPNPNPPNPPDDPDYLLYTPVEPEPPQPPDLTEESEEEPAPDNQEQADPVEEESEGVGFAIGVNFPMLRADFYGNINVNPPEPIIPYAAMIGDTGVILDFHPPGSTGNPIDFILSDSNLSYNEILAAEDDSGDDEDSEEDDDDDTVEETTGGSASQVESVSDLPAGFRGVKINHLKIIYQKDHTDFPQITFRNAAIGSGGFWGEVYLGTPPPTSGTDIRLSKAELDALFPNGNSPARTNTEGSNRVAEQNSSTTHIVYPINIAGMKAAFQYFGIGFRQSVPEWGSLRGFIFMPLVNKWVSLRASIGGPNGDFMLEIGGVGDEGLINLETDIFKITADSIAYQYKDPHNYAIISGSIRLKVPGNMNMPEFRVQKMSISDKGDVEIEGGWVRAPQAVTLDMGGFKISISEFGIGSDGDTPQTKKQWIGFSGSVQLAEGIPIKGSVDGLKISWDSDEKLAIWNAANPTNLKKGMDTVDVSLRGIGVELKIPGTLELVGEVSYHKPEQTDPPTPNAFTGFKGHVRLNLIALKMEIEGTVMIGKSKDEQGREFTVFYIQIAATLPTAIPLGGTGTGLYGIEGLFGLNVAPTKTEAQKWYDWYIAPPARNLTGLAKWQPMNDNLAFGVGVKIGTMYDDGTTLNLGAMLVVLIPGPVIMLEGKANLLKKRSDNKQEDGALYLLAVLDCRVGTFQLNIDVRYNLQDIVEIGGGLEAFFDFNNSNNWYIYIGRKEPESKRLQAKILKNLFTANAYFMIDPRAIQFGASVGVRIVETYGPVELRLVAGISLDAAIFFKPFQMTGELHLIADVGVTVLGIGIRLMLEALLGGKVPEPYLVYGRARVVIQLFWPLPSFDFPVEFRWEQDLPTKAITPLLKDAEPKVDQPGPRKLAYMKHHKSSDVNIELFYKDGPGLPESNQVPIVPVDARPVLTFAKKLHQVGNETLIIASDQVGNGEFRYHLQDLVLEDITDPSNPVVVRQGINPDAATTPPGFHLIMKTNNDEPTSIVNGEEAKEPSIELWNTSLLDRNNSYQNENSQNPCRTPEWQLRIVNFVGEAERDLPPIFQHHGLFFISETGTETETVEVRDYNGKKTGEQKPVTKSIPRIEKWFRYDGNPKTEDPGVKSLRARKLTIIFPEDISTVAFVTIPFTYNSLENETGDYTGMKVTAYTTDGELVEGVIDSQQAALMHSFNLTPPANKAIRFLSIEDSSLNREAFWLLGFTYITQADTNQLRLLRYRAPSASPVATPVVSPLVLSPNRLYRLKVYTAVTGNGGFDQKELPTRPERPEHPDYFYFRTDQGPGVDGDLPYKDNPVNKFRTYISNAFPAEGAPNHYFGEKIKINFNEAYVRQIFDNRGLRLRVRDRNGVYIGESVAGWADGRAPLVHNGTMSWLSARFYYGCSSPNPPVYEPVAVFNPPTMKPNTLYFAEITIGEGPDRKVIHDYSFTTSRYSSFGTHIGDIGNAQARRIDAVNVGPWHPDFQQLFNQIEYFREGQQGFLASMAQYSQSMARAEASHKNIVDEFEGLKRRKTMLETTAADLFDQLYRHVEPAFEVHPTLPDGSPVILPDGTPAVIDMRQRGLPARPEIIQIPLTGTEYSLLLLESPEPIDWIGLSGTCNYPHQTISAIANKDKTRAFLMTDQRAYFSNGQFTFNMIYTPFVGLENSLEAGDTTQVARRGSFTVSVGLQLKVMAIQQSLPAGDSIESPNKMYQLTYQWDGDLVLSSFGVRLWNTRTAGQPAGRVTMQADGNLVMYTPDNRAVWSSNTWGPTFAGTVLQLRDDGNLALVHPQLKTVWATQTANGVQPNETLRPGEILLPTQSLYSNNRQFRFTYQADGNLVLYRTNDGTALWASGTHGQPAGRFEMKANGVLAIYGPNNAMQWAARYAGAQPLGHRLQLGDNGAVTILAADGSVVNTIEHLELVSPGSENFIAFRHTADAGNIHPVESNITILDHPQLNGNPEVVLFVSPLWGNASFGMHNPNILGVRYSEGRWMILNQDKLTPMVLGAGFMVMATTTQNPHVFVHTATGNSISMTRSYIDHPLSNKRPNALLMVTQHYGEYNNREIGVGYEPANEQWFVHNKLIAGADPYNESLNGIPLYAKFNVLVLADNHIPGITAFVYQVDAQNFIPGAQHVGFLDHAAINNRPDAFIFFTESWHIPPLNTQPASNGWSNQSVSCLWYDDPIDSYHAKDGYWSIYNTAGNSMEQGRMFNVFVLEEQANLLPMPPVPVLDERFTFVAYRHKVGTSINPEASASRLDHPLLNNNPNAMVFANSNYGYRNEGLDNGDLFGVRYNGTNWELASQSGQPNTMSPAYWFNILIAPQDCPNVFTHMAHQDSLQLVRSYLDHPLVNGRPDVHIMVTQNLTNGRATQHEIAVAYENGRWFIYNNVRTLEESYDQVNHGIPEGARFNVLVLTGAEQSNVEVLAHRALAKNIIPRNQNISFISHQKLDHNREAMVFATSAWLPVLGGWYNPSMIALWYDDELDSWKYKEGFWSVYNSTPGVPMVHGVVFNVFVVT